MNDKNRLEAAQEIDNCRNLPVIQDIQELRYGRWVTIAVAKKAMNCKMDSSVRTQIRKGRLRGARFGNTLLVNLTDIHKYVRQRKQGAFRKGGRPRKAAAGPVDEA